MNPAVEKLKKENVGAILLNEPLANHTTWKIGGPADVMIIPNSQNALLKTVQILNECQIPWFVIGRGSNLLVKDRGIRGAVIKISDGLSQLTINQNKVTVGAGYSLIRLTAVVAKAGLSGLEFAGGIPGSIGGALFMNAGAHGSDISRILVEASVLQEDGSVVRLKGADFHFAYRHSILQTNNWIVLEATFALSFDEPKNILKRMESFKQRRRITQPLQYPCAGSVFRNPPGDYAGRLIESAGLKGLRVGDAMISYEHSNFIINCGKAKAKDVLELMEKVKQIIHEKYGIWLVPEVRVVGEG